VTADNLSLMGKWNFNITFPIYDALLGTRYREPASAVTPPPAAVP
jgi:hypothetical protein